MATATDRPDDERELTPAEHDALVYAQADRDVAAAVEIVREWQKQDVDIILGDVLPHILELRRLHRPSAVADLANRAAEILERVYPGGGTPPVVPGSQFGPRPHPGLCVCGDCMALRAMFPDAGPLAAEGCAAKHPDGTGKGCTLNAGHVGTHYEGREW